MEEEVKIGQEFGKYTVVKQVDKPKYLKNKGTYWLCRCECGNETIMSTGTINRNIKTNHSMSCVNVEKIHTTYQVNTE